MVVSGLYDLSRAAQLTVVKPKDPNDKIAYIGKATAKAIDVVDWGNILISPKKQSV